MSVTRERPEVVDAICVDVAEAVRNALARGQASYVYCTTSESDDHLEVRTVVRPNLFPLILSTQLRIQLHPEESQTRIIARTSSQWFILGDIFDFYGGYLRDVFTAVRHSLEKCPG